MRPVAAAYLYSTVRTAARHRLGRAAERDVYTGYLFMVASLRSNSIDNGIYLIFYMLLC